MLKIFENPEFGEIRTLLDEKGDVLFCATDVAKALGYAKPRNAVGTHCRGALKQGSPTSSGIQELSWIYEPDVYRLIIKSKLPAAEKFEAWLFEEVLPAIRKHGMYFTQDTVADIFKKVKSPTNSIGNGWEECNNVNRTRHISYLYTRKIERNRRN